MHKSFKYLQKQLSTNQGFSLVELLIAMLVLMLIVFAFTPLLAGSIAQLQYAGDKSEAVYLGQSDIEEMIVKQQTMGGDEITIELADPDDPEDPVVTLEISGGYFETIQEKGGATAWLSSFIPYVPAIELEPDSLIEGYDKLDITVLGRETNLQEDQDITLLDNNGEKVDNYTSQLTLEVDETGYDQVGSFELDEGLPNQGSPYAIQISWELEQDIDITVRSRLKVKLPYAVVVGDGQRILVSPDLMPDQNGIRWKVKQEAQSGVGSIEDISWTGFEYVAVTSNGTALVIQNNKELFTTNIHSGKTFYSIDHGDLTLIAVGESGLIYTSRNGRAWDPPPSGSGVTSDLYTVSWDSNEERVVAGGEDGTILYSDDLGESWDKAELSTNTNVEYITFGGITHGNGTWIAVGEDHEEDEDEGVIFKSSDGVNWDQVDNSDIAKSENTVFNAVTYGDGQFVAVGSDGVIIVSENGNEWDSKLQGLTTEENDPDDLFSILWEESIGKFLITGDGGTILVGNDYEEKVNWDKRTGPGVLKGAVVR